MCCLESLFFLCNFRGAWPVWSCIFFVFGSHAHVPLMKVRWRVSSWVEVPTKCQSNLPNKNLFGGKILLLILSFCVLHEYFLFSATYGALPVQSCNFDLFGILTLSWWYIMHVDGI